MVRAVFILLFIVCLLKAPTPAGAAEGVAMKPGEFLVLCYHSVPLRASRDNPMTVPQRLFVSQMEYLRTHGYHPVSLDDIIKAGRGEGQLPEKPVLLTFDDAYESYYDFVVPLLAEYGYPSLLAVVGTFIDNPPDDIPEPLMTWNQLRQLARKPLVEIASHSFDLHKAIQYTPQGNVGAAARVRTYDKERGSYESESAYRKRISRDFKAQTRLFRKKLGITPRAIVWPYGRYTRPGVEEALDAGYRLNFTLEEGYAHVERLDAINRHLVYNEPVEDFISVVTGGEVYSRLVGDRVSPIRAAQIDLDTIYDPDSAERTGRNLDRLIDRLVAMKVNTVFLQAFADPDGTGTIASLYFPNTILPVRTDLFGHTVHQMIIRDMKVFAWMPTLSIELADRERNERLRVRESSPEGVRPSTSWYGRLSPFDGEVRGLMVSLYEDLAAHTQISGVLFQDDAYLAEGEDYHPSAIAAYRERFGEEPVMTGGEGSAPPSPRWTRYKTEQLIDFTAALMEGVKKYSTEARFARNIYPALLTDPGSEASFAQNYARFLDAYHLVVVMTYSRMERIGNPSPWLEGLVNTARKAGGLEKSIFKVQSYDWKENEWIGDTVLLEEMRDLLSAGAKHIAYYPDNALTDNPSLTTIGLEMSTEVYPFMP